MKTVIQVLLGLGLLGTLVFFLNPEQVAGVMSKITLTALTILFSLQLLTLAAGAWIWHFLLNRRSRVSYAWVPILLKQRYRIHKSLIKVKIPRFCADYIHLPGSFE